MATLKEVQTKIGGVKKTSQITSAMNMVAAAKLRGAQEKMESFRPYTEKFNQAMSSLAGNMESGQFPLMEVRDVRTVELVIVTSDRGLCGGLNSNLFRAVVSRMAKWRDEKVEIDLCTIGTKAAGFFSRMGGNLVAQVGHLGDAPQINDLIGSVKVMLDAFDEGRIDQLYVVSNDFVNTMTQKPLVAQLLPIKAAEDEALQHHWDYLYEPEAKDVINSLLIRYVESMVYQGVVENMACEQAARMVAMKAEKKHS